MTNPKIQEALVKLGAANPELRQAIRPLLTKVAVDSDDLNLEQAYEYKRAGWLFTGLLADALLAEGHSPDQVTEWIYSKEYRHALDGKLGDLLKHAAQQYAKTVEMDDEG